MTTKYDPDNVFARILRGELPCSKVLENQHALAMHDVNPQAPVHVLVLPKGAYVHQTDFAANASADEKLALYDAISAVVAKLDLTAGGYRLIVNEGVAARQEVPHLHWHVLAGKDLGALLPANLPNAA